MNPRSLAFCSLVALAAATGLGSTAHAQKSARGVGLGVAAGLAYSPTNQGGLADADPIGTGVAWGFFVDIPVLDTFYISPAAILYERDLGRGRKPVTDIDLAFKFIVPAGPVKIGAGLLTGVSTIEEDYAAHWGFLLYTSVNLVANLDAFVLAEYKRMMREGQTNIDDIHGYAGFMFRL